MSRESIIPNQDNGVLISSNPSNAGGTRKPVKIAAATAPHYHLENGNDDNEASMVIQFPGYPKCPISAEPPACVYTLDVPSDDGITAPLVFKYTEIFIHIATEGTLPASRN